MYLSEAHSYLYKRVRLKAILHTVLGLILILFPSDPQNAGQITVVQKYVGEGLTFFGISYLIVGLLIFAGLRISRNNYRFLRTAMTIAAIYNTLWFILLLAILSQRATRSIAYITGLYGYLTYNIWYVRNDPGWKAIQIVKEMREHDGNVGIDTSTL